MEFMKHLFSSEGFIPRGHCLLWKQDLVWLHVVSDSIITLAYYSIPIMLVYLARKRRDMTFQWMFLMFGALILGYGTTHLMGTLTLWIPSYWLDGGIKLATAVFSIATAALLIPIMPKVLAMRNPAELEAINLELERQIAKRKRIETALHESEERYRSLIENAPICIHKIGLSGHLMSMNRVGLQMMNVKDESQVCGLSYLDAVAPEDRGRIGTLLASAYEGEASEFEFSGIGRRVFTSSFIPLKGADGSILKLMGITQDITERKS